MKENRQNLSNWLHKLLSVVHFWGKEETCQACQIFSTVTVMAKREQKWPLILEEKGGNTGVVMCERASRYECGICQSGSYHISIFKIQAFNW